MVIFILFYRQYIGKMNSVKGVIVPRRTRIRFYKERAKPTSGTVRVTDQRRVVSAEDLFMRTVGHNSSVLLRYHQFSQVTKCIE